MKKFIISVGICALTMMNVSASLMVRDDFNQSDYGVSIAGLPGLSGGTNWNGAWAGNANVKYVPTQNYIYTNAVGYVDTGIGNGAIGSTSIVSVTVTRSFSSSTVSSGVVWFSWVGNRSSASSVSDRLGINFYTVSGVTTNVVFIGERSADFGIGNASGSINIYTNAGVWAAGTSHLVIGKIDLSTGNVSAWLNSTNVTSEAMLGTASASVTESQLGYDLSSLNGTTALYFGENAAVRVSLDGLKIGSSLSSVIPEPATIGMLGLGALITLILRRKISS